MAAFRNGDRVVVPWGLDEREGTVVDSFGPPARRFVTVRIFFSDEDDARPDDIVFLSSELRHVARA